MKNLIKIIFVMIPFLFVISCGTSKTSSTDPAAAAIAAQGPGCLKNHPDWVTPTLSGVDCAYMEDLYNIDPADQANTETVFKQLAQWQLNGGPNAKSLSNTITYGLLVPPDIASGFTAGTNDDSGIKTFNNIVLMFAANATGSGVSASEEETILGKEEALLSTFVTSGSYYGSGGLEIQASVTPLLDTFFSPCYAPASGQTTVCDKQILNQALNFTTMSIENSETIDLGYVLNCLGTVVLSRLLITSSFRESLATLCTTTEPTNPKLTTIGVQLYDIMIQLGGGVINAVNDATQAQSTTIENGCFTPSAASTSPSYGVSSIASCDELAYDTINMAGFVSSEDPGEQTIHGVPLATFMHQQYENYISMQVSDRTL